MKQPKFSQNIIRMIFTSLYNSSSVKLRNVIAVLTFLTFVVGCKSVKIIETQPKSEHLQFTFVQVNDVYEIAPLSGGKYGGMARVAHVRDSIKALQPNTFLVMAGDFLNPSLLGTLKLDGERIGGRHMIEVMNAMEFDLVTFGNHEFDLKAEDFQKRLNEAEFPWTTANVYQVTDDGNRSFETIKGNDTLRVAETFRLPIIEADTVAMEVGVFSVTIDSNPQDYVFYSNYLLEGSTAFHILKAQGANVILGLTHLEIEQDIALSNSLPDVPFIMGGHEHYSMIVPTKFGAIAKADANAKSVYVHQFNFNRKTKELKVISKLIPIDNTVASQPKTKAVVDKWNAILEDKIKEVVANPDDVVYEAKTPLDGTDSAMRSIQTNLGRLITAGMEAAYGNEVDGVFVNGGSFRIDDMLSGDITSLDIFRVLPFGGSVLKVKLKGSLLKEILDYGKSKRGTGAYVQRHTITESTNGKWQIGGKLIDPNATYTIATIDFLLKGFDIPFLTKENPGVVDVYEPKSTELAGDIRKAVILYLRSINK